MTDTIYQQPASKPHKLFPTVTASALWVVAFLVLQIVVSIAAVAISFGPDLAKPGADVAEVMQRAQNLKTIALPTIWALTISNALILLGLFFYLRKDNRAAAIHSDRWSQAGNGPTLILIIAVLVLIFAANFIYSTYVIPDVMVQKEMRDLFAAIPQTYANTALLFVAVVLLAPIVEEYLFRGLLQTSLMHKMPPYAAIGLSSVVFGLIHMDPFAFPVLAILGAAFGYLYYKTGSLRINIAVHVLNNALALLLT